MTERERKSVCVWARTWGEGELEERGIEINISSLKIRVREKWKRVLRVIQEKERGLKFK